MSLYWSTLDLHITARTDKEADSGLTTGHSDDVIGGLSTLPDISVAFESNMEGGVVRESQQDRATLRQLRSRDNVKEPLGIKRKITVCNSPFSSSKSNASSSHSKLSVLFYFYKYKWPKPLII